MNKPTRNPEYERQFKIYENAFGIHQSMGRVSKKEYTKEEILKAFENMRIEWEKLNSINLFVECKDCQLDKSKCVECIYKFYKVIK